MPRLGDLVSDKASVVVPFGEAALHVSYRPNVVTPAFQRAVMQAQTGQDIDQALLWPLAELVASWDLVDDDGQVIPTTPEGFAGVPSSVLLTVLNAITDDMAPNRMRGAGSSNGSSPTAALAAPPSGT